MLDSTVSLIASWGIYQNLILKRAKAFIITIDNTCTLALIPSGVFRVLHVSG